jgi:hypothetical protein
MKNKLIKKVVIGGIISIVLLIAAFCISIFISSTLAGISYKNYVERTKRENERLDKEEAETLAEYRDIKPMEFLQFLKNNCQYFSVSDRDSNINRLFEVQVENGAPVVYEIDFCNGERITRMRTVLNNYIGEISRCVYSEENFLNNEPQDYYYRYDYMFLENYGRKINFFTDRDGSNILSSIQIGLVPCILYESKNIDKILGELSSRITKTQTQYCGEYEYETTEIIQEYGNMNGSTEIKTAKNISVIYTDTGNLYAQFSFDEPADNYGISFFIDDHTDNEISSKLMDGHAGTVSSRWYIEGDYIIYHLYSERGYFEGGDGHTIEFKSYFKKRANGA